MSTYGKPITEYPEPAATDVGITPVPKICIGFNPKENSWRQTGVSWEKLETDCPKNYAYFSVSSPGGRFETPGQVPVLGTCCPLPDGVLTEQHVYHSDKCPDDYVVTGVLAKNVGDSHRATNYLKCTAINFERYQLGPEMPSIEFGWSAQKPVSYIPGLYPVRTTRSRIPAAIRYGILRKDFIVWEESGCVGFPWGSLLVRKSGKRCSQFFFRQLQYRGIKGDPSTGSMVQIFPKCRTISDPLSANPKCND